MLVTSPWGIGILKQNGSGLEVIAIAKNGVSLDGWRLNTDDNRFGPTGDFDGDGYTEILIQSKWGIGLLKLNGSDLGVFAMVKNGTSLEGWRLNTDDNQFGVIKNIIEGEDEPRPASWKTGNWGRCQGNCGINNARQTRSVQCTDDLGESVSSSRCYGTPPLSSRPCTKCRIPPPTKPDQLPTKPDQPGPMSGKDWWVNCKCVLGNSITGQSSNVRVRYCSNSFSESGGAACKKHQDTLETGSTCRADFIDKPVNLKTECSPIGRVIRE